MSDLHLQEFKATSFLGINAQSPVVLDFTENKSKLITTFIGNQGTRKTSTLTALMMMMGAAFDIDMKHFNNLTDDTTKLDHKFTYQGSNYHATLSGGRLTLKKQYKEAGDKWIAEGSPKEMLRMIFGTLGVSPMHLKSMDGKKQIEWFKNTFGKDAEASKKEQKKISELQKVIDERKLTNREIKSLKGWLDQNDLYKNYEKSAKKFEKPVNAAVEKKKFDEITKKKSDYDRYTSTLDLMKGTVKDLDHEIDELALKLEAKKAERAEVAERIKKGDEWLKSCNGIEKEYEEANKAWLNISKTIADERTWKEVLEKEKEYNKATDLHTKQESSIDQLRTDLLKITKSYLPEIPGLEVRVKVELTDTDEGLYYQGKTLAQLSESELWDLFLKIWEDYEVRFIFCENIQDLGSEAIKTLNRLVKEKKARVFASEMDRTKKEMEISFSTKVE